jgi:hypothetical protein
LNGLKEKGFEIIYGTCSEKRLRGYQFMGFEVIDQHIFKNEKKYLLQMSVDTI